MNYYSRKDIEDIIKGVLSEMSGKKCELSAQKEVPVEVSARHVHLTEKALHALFGQESTLTKKRDLSQRISK